jgi:hypothetical protein
MVAIKAELMARTDVAACTDANGVATPHINTAVAASFVTPFTVTRSIPYLKVNNQ